jgi:uncharacterized protein
MHGASDSLSARCLRRLARWVGHHPRWSSYPHLFLVAGAIFFTVRSLEFSTDRNDLVGADKQYHRNYLAYKEAFDAQDELVVLVESEDVEKNRQFIERLGARLHAESNLFTDVLFNRDVKMLGNKALLFFPEDELEALREILLENLPALRTFNQATNLVSLFRLINLQFRTAPREPSTGAESLIDILPALERIVLQAEDSLQRPGIPPSPGLTALFDAGTEVAQQVYITFANGQLFLLTTRALSEPLNKKAVHRLRELVEITRIEVPGVNAAVTGEPVLEFDEMSQSQRDTTVAGTLALVCVALIFIFAYRESGRPLKALVCLVTGLAYTMAFATAVIGHLNILTITFVPMLVGLAIDFGVHLVTRYEEELRLGHSELDALEKAMVPTGQGIFTGCFTTSGAFFAMGLTDFKGIQEMGIICGGGLLICLIPMMTLLPALLLHGNQNVLDHASSHSAARRRARLEQLWLTRPIPILTLATIFSLLAIQGLKRVYFDYNLLNLQTADLTAVVFEHKLIESTDKSVLYCAVIAHSLDEALDYEQRVRSLPSVASVESMSPFLAQNHIPKLAIVSQIKQDLADLHFGILDTSPVNVRELSATLWRTQGYFGAASKAASQAGEPTLASDLQQLRINLGNLRRTMLGGDRDRAANRLADFQNALFTDVYDTFNIIKNQDDTGPILIDDLPPALRRRFISNTGDLHLIQVYPKEDVWQRHHQAAFLADLRHALDPYHTGQPVITGTPVQLFEYTGLLKNSYEQAARYALAAIALLVLIHFRSIVCVILALLPVGLGTLWMVGIMGFMGQPFNPANIMTLPLVIGIGVTSGIHILNRFTEEQSPAILSKSTGKAVLISGLTTVVGFGSLLIAKHQGIASLGYVMAVGTSTCMLAALTVMPAFLRLLNTIGWQPGKKPSDQTKTSALGWEEPR